MALNLQETELISTFDYGISLGDVISGSEYIWCINSKDNCLTIKSTREVGQTSLPYHDFGILSNEKFSITTGTDFEYNKQKYLVLSVEICGQNKRNLLTVFKLSVSKVTCTFQVPYKVTNLQVLVKNVHFIENGKNASFFGNFEVSCLAACAGGAVQVFDITPGELDELDSNEAQPLDVYWVDNSEHLVNEDIERGKQIALKQSKVFGFFINRGSLSKNSFDYVMANDQVTTSLPTELVKVTSLKYERQIDSVLIGFNFGCFQIWSMKTLSIESSSGYGENSKPVVGFSLLQPQNDPQKCVYLIVAHSRSLKEVVANYKKAKMEDMDETNDENQSHDFEIDEDDDESESSFILMYQLIYDKCVHIFLNQSESYMLYEGINHCGLVFEHDFSLDTLKCVKTNYANELNNEFSTTLSELFTNDLIDSSNSKIISIQTTSVCNNRLQLDLACIIWALADKKSSSSDNFFLSVFNLNNWYLQCMPSKMRPMVESLSSRKNAYFTNYTLSINCELDAIKFISLIDTKIRKVKNQNNLSLGNVLRELLVERCDALYECDDTIGYDIDEETYLSMSFDLMMLTPFTLTKISIKPIEHQIHQFISQQDDLIHYPEKVFYLLTRYHLIDKFVNDNSQPKFIPIFNYLLETSQIYGILKSLWKLNNNETMIMTDCSLGTVLDWAWSKVCVVKKELNNLNEKICLQLTNHFNRHPADPIERDNLSEFLNRENNMLDNLIQIFKQFLKLNSTSEGHEQLNKKLCSLESIKCYVEHLILFNKYELLLPPSASSHDTDLNDSSCLFKNYLSEIEGNFKIIQNRCSKRRLEQTNHKYPFTYMIDCLIEECRPFANVSKFFLKNKKQVKFSDQGNKSDTDDLNLIYPPKSILELLEICLECNLSTKMKQILILYVLCDLMHTEMSESVKKHILKVINAYCSTSFTIMSTNLDAAISVPWSSSVTSIVSLGSDPNNPNQSSCLFDLVNGLYLIDSHFVERSFKYLRGIDVNYLEFYEKYFILYNSACLDDFKMAAQYLWLFQKLNASSIPASAGIIENMSHNVSEQSDLFKIFPKTISVDTNSQCSILKHEQMMHARLMLTIYLANSLVNEAYELIRPHIVHLKTCGASAGKLSKQLICHFFAQSEMFKQWKQISKLTSLDSDFLLVLLNYLEAKKELDSIGKAIDLHVNNRNYKKAIQLYEKHHQLISSSAEFAYLSSMIEIAKEMQNDYTSTESLNQYNLITSTDLRESASFEYKFSLPLKEVCKNSKRCLNLLTAPDDIDYINLLKFADTDHTQSASRVKIASEITNIVSSETPSREFISSSCKKRKASTPHPNHIKHTIRLESPDDKPLAKHLFMSECKDRILTSALKSKNITQSVSKSVKFKSTRITREFTNDNVFDREEEEKRDDEENEENVAFDDAPKRLEFDDDSEKSTMADSEFELRLDESTKMEDESMHFEEKKIDIDCMMSQIPILSRTDELRKSIFEKVTSSARKSIGDLTEPVKSSITIEPIANVALLHKCSTVKEFESPFKTDNKYSLDTAPFSPIKNKDTEVANGFAGKRHDVLNQEFIEPKSTDEEAARDRVNFEIGQNMQEQLSVKINHDELKNENTDLKRENDNLSGNEINERANEEQKENSSEDCARDELMNVSGEGIDEKTTENEIMEKVKDDCVNNGQVGEPEVVSTAEEMMTNANNDDDMQAENCEKELEQNIGSKIDYDHIERLDKDKINEEKLEVTCDVSSSNENMDKVNNDEKMEEEKEMIEENSEEKNEPSMVSNEEAKKDACNEEKIEETCEVSSSNEKVSNDEQMEQEKEMIEENSEENNELSVVSEEKAKKNACNEEKIEKTRDVSSSNQKVNDEEQNEEEKEMIKENNEEKNEPSMASNEEAKKDVCNEEKIEETCEVSSSNVRLSNDEQMEEEKEVIKVKNDLVEKNLQEVVLSEKKDTIEVQMKEDNKVVRVRNDQEIILSEENYTDEGKVNEEKKFTNVKDDQEIDKSMAEMEEQNEVGEAKEECLKKNEQKVVSSKSSEEADMSKGKEQIEEASETLPFNESVEKEEKPNDQGNNLIKTIDVANENPEDKKIVMTDFEAGKKLNQTIDLCDEVKASAPVSGDAENVKDHSDTDKKTSSEETNDNVCHMETVNDDDVIQEHVLTSEKLHEDKKIVMTDFEAGKKLNQTIDLCDKVKASAPVSGDAENVKDHSDTDKKTFNEETNDNVCHMETVNDDDVTQEHVLTSEKLHEDKKIVDVKNSDLTEPKCVPSGSQTSVFSQETINTSLNSADRTLEDKNDSNEDMDLNLSSVSNSEAKQVYSQDSIDKLELPDDRQLGLSRSSSQTSLLSQISSVSEHFEEKRGLKRRAPVTKARLDDIEPRPTRTSTLRRKSELPKPATESRVTRGKSRPSLEPEKLAPRTITRRNSKRTDTKLEKLAEEEDLVQTISAANLKKHNAQIESDASKPKTARLTRSKARSPSPSASSIISCSSVTSVESTSTFASLVVKTRGKKSKKIEQDEQMDRTIKVDEETKEPENSPTSSIASVNSSASARVTRRSTRVKKEEVEEDSSPKRKYGLRKKKEDEEEEAKVSKSARKTTRTRSFRENKSDEVEKAKVTRTRSLRSSTTESKGGEGTDKAKSSLAKISEGAEAKVDSKLTAPRIVLRKYDAQK